MTDAISITPAPTTAETESIRLDRLEEGIEVAGEALQSLSGIIAFLDGEGGCPPTDDAVEAMRAQIEAATPCLRQHGVRLPSIEYEFDPIGYIEAWHHILGNVLPFLADQRMPEEEMIFAHLVTRH